MPNMYADFGQFAEGFTDGVNTTTTATGRGSICLEDLETEMGWAIVTSMEANSLLVPAKMTVNANRDIPARLLRRHMAEFAREITDKLTQIVKDKIEQREIEILEFLQSRPEGTSAPIMGRFRYKDKEYGIAPRFYSESTAMEASILAIMTSQTVWEEWNLEEQKNGDIWGTARVRAFAEIWEEWTRIIPVREVDEATEEERREQEAEQAKKEIGEKAKRLLLKNLTSQQQKQFQKDGTIKVTSQSRKRYLVSGTKLVKLLSGGDGGKNYCVVPKEGEDTIPLADKVLMKKLHLEHNEKELLEIANEQ